MNDPGKGYIQSAKIWLASRDNPQVEDDIRALSRNSKHLQFTANAANANHSEHTKRRVGTIDGDRTQGLLEDELEMVGRIRIFPPDVQAEIEELVLTGGPDLDNRIREPYMRGLEAIGIEKNLDRDLGQMGAIYS